MPQYQPLDTVVEQEQYNDRSISSILPHSHTYIKPTLLETGSDNSSFQLDFAKQVKYSRPMSDEVSLIDNYNDERRMSHIQISQFDIDKDNVDEDIDYKHPYYPQQTSNYTSLTEKKSNKDFSIPRKPVGYSLSTSLTDPSTIDLLVDTKKLSIPRKPVKMATTPHARDSTFTQGSYNTLLSQSHDRLSLQSQDLENNRLSQTLTEEKRDAYGAPDWDGPWDRDNPRNWPFWERCFATTIPAAACFVVASSASIYVPGTVDLDRLPNGPMKIVTQFGVSQTISLLGLTLFVLGLGFGPMLGAPISETRGRKIVYLISLPIFALFTIGVALSKSIGSILVLRFFAGMFGSPCLAVGAGTVADVWDFQIHGGIVGPLFLIMAFFGPAIGPFAGGHIVSTRNWESTMWVSAVMTAPVILATLFMRETYKKVVLMKRSEKRGYPAPPKPPPKEALKLLVTVTLFRPVAMIFLEPIVWSTSLYNGFCFAVLFGFFEAIPYVFKITYNFNTAEIGNTFLGVGLGIIFSALTAMVFDQLLYQKYRVEAVRKNETVAPEHRLYPAMLGSILLPISIFWFAWFAKEDVHWIMPVIGATLFGWGVVASFIGTAGYLLDAYDALVGASALAANSLVRYTMGASFPLFTVQMYEKLGVQWAGILLAFVAVGLMPIPWLLFRYGPWLRARSRYNVVVV